MKRIVLLFAIILASSGLRAQYSNLYYHRVGDTIEWRAPIGYYSWWEFEYFYQNDIAVDVTGLSAVSAQPWNAGLGRMLMVDSIVVLQRFYTPVPLKIIGVSGSPYQRESESSFVPRPSVTQEYFYVFDATSTDLVQVAEAPWSILDPHRTIHLITHHASPVATPLGGVDSCCKHNPVDSYIPIYEYYFDSAVYVADSFYVGGSVYCFFATPNPVDSGVLTSYRCVCTWHYPSACDSSLLSHISHNCTVTNVDYILMGKSLTDRSWIRDYYNYTDKVGGYIDYYLSPGIIYPIIEVDTTVPPEGYCPTVAGLAVMTADSGCVMVTWDAFPNYSGYTLQYGPANVPTDSWTSVEVGDSTFYRICGLSTAGLYGVRIKAECDKNETNWSNTVSFYSSGIPVDPGDTTAAVPTALSAYTFLSPNPAHESVWVSSSFGLQNIDIYNAQGLLVYSSHASGHRTEVPLEGLPAGTYIMAITTFNGTTHKKLLIQ